MITFYRLSNFSFNISRYLLPNSREGYKHNFDFQSNAKESIGVLR